MWSGEKDPGIGFWISVAVGVAAGVGALVLGAGWVVALVVLVVVAGGMALLLS